VAAELVALSQRHCPSPTHCCTRACLPACLQYIPTLVIHGGKDYRLGEAEGIAAFTALQRRGIASRFLYFPDENHWVLRPVNSMRWHLEVLAWMDAWCKPAKGGAGSLGDRDAAMARAARGDAGGIVGAAE
jgi:hypothetical protein